MQAVFVKCDFCSGMQHRNELAKTFVETFVAQNKYYPR